MPLPSKKKCSSCGKIFPLKDFPKRKDKNSVRGICKKCTAGYYKKLDDYHKANPEFVETPQRWFFEQIKRNAKKRKIPFKITFKKFIESYSPICQLTGQEIKLTKLQREASGNQTASLDRIDSSKGYEEGNIQWVNWEINLLKNSHPQKKFIELCKLVANKT